MDTPYTLKSIPVGELAVTALVHVSLSNDATGQDCGGQDYVDVELELIDPELNNAASFKTFDGRCACCGSTRLRYACHVVHTPTMTGHYIGRDCATKLLGMADGAYDRMSVALAEKAKARRRRNWWLSQNPQHREIVEWAEAVDHRIAADVVRRLKQNGSISEAQVELLHRIKAQIAERAAAAAAEPKPTGPAPEGRLEVTVTVLGTKKIENRFSRYGGTTTKALVRLDGYNTKAWITVRRLDRGDRAVIRATFQRSDRDQFFAFGSRPTVVRIVES